MIFSKSFNDKGRNSAIDVFRAIAILAVVIYHFKNVFLPFGYMGVDLFFVISGTLIGGILIRQLKSGHPINFFKFILQRGFKIWPSYYFFLIIGNLLALCFYGKSHPGQVIPLWDLKRYVLFYQNYTGLPFHWSFDHVWSLCVEEHFYILLPILFIIIQITKYKKQLLLCGILLTIIAGVLFKFASFYLTRSHDTYAGTHNRIDGLAWGVLLSFIINYSGQQIKYKLLCFLSGLVLLIAATYYSTFDNLYFNKLFLHSLIPVSFFLMLLGAFYFDLSRLKVLRMIAYYSYNWYLWHPIFVLFLTEIIGSGPVAFTVYLLVTLFVAMLATHLIEEPLLRKRERVLNRLFYRKRPERLVEVVKE